MKMMKVIQTENEEPREILFSLLISIFPDFSRSENYLISYNEVRFNYISAGSMWHHKFSGVTLESGRYGNLLRRRVLMNKEGMIDTDAIKAKYIECNTHGFSVREMLGIEEWKLTVVSDSTVIMSGTVDFGGLHKLTQIIGKPIEVEVTVEVNELQAKEAWDILQGGNLPIDRQI